MIEPNAPGFQVKDFKDGDTVFTTEKRYLEDGTARTRVRMTYIRGKYIGFTFTVNECEQLIVQLSLALAQAKEWNK